MHHKTRNTLQLPNTAAIMLYCQGGLLQQFSTDVTGALNSAIFYRPEYTA